MDAKIIEQGNGLPQVGEVIYDWRGDCFYRVLSFGRIQTDDSRGYAVNAVLNDDVDADSYAEGELEQMRPVVIERERRAERE